jgi:hypothetical protein
MRLRLALKQMDVLVVFVAMREENLNNVMEWK